MIRAEMQHPLLPHKYSELYQQAIPLNRWNPGSDEVAFDRTTAFKALQELKGSAVAVVGGDVVNIIDGHLKYTYENWSVPDKLDESPQDYVRRSHERAREYVEGYAEDDLQPFFVFVLSYFPQVNYSQA